MTKPTILNQSDDGNSRTLYRQLSIAGVELVDQELTEDGWEDINVVVLGLNDVHLLIPLFYALINDGATVQQPTPGQLRHTVNLLFASYIRTIAGVQASWDYGESPTPESAMGAAIHALRADNVDVVDSATELVGMLNQLGIFDEANSTGHRDDKPRDNTETGFSAGILSQE